MSFDIGFARHGMTCHPDRCRGTFKVDMIDVTSIRRAITKRKIFTNWIVLRSRVRRMMRKVFMFLGQIDAEKDVEIWNQSSKMIHCNCTTHARCHEGRHAIEVAFLPHKCIGKNNKESCSVKTTGISPRKADTQSQSQFCCPNCSKIILPFTHFHSKVLVNCLDDVHSHFPQGTCNDEYIQNCPHPVLAHHQFHSTKQTNSTCSTCIHFTYIPMFGVESAFFLKQAQGCPFSWTTKPHLWATDDTDSRPPVLWDTKLRAIRNDTSPARSQSPAIGKKSQCQTKTWDESRATQDQLCSEEGGVSVLNHLTCVWFRRTLQNMNKNKVHFGIQDFRTILPGWQEDVEHWALQWNEPLQFQ